MHKFQKNKHPDPHIQRQNVLLVIIVLYLIAANFFVSICIQIATMSSSKAKSAKYMKAIAAYEQADITEAVSVLDREQQRVLVDLVKKIHNKLEGMHVEAVKRKVRKPAIPTVTQEQKLSAVIIKIKNALDAYDSTDDIEEWIVEFTVGMNFDVEPLPSIQSHHDKLLKTESTSDKVKLLASMERGRLYDYLKYSSFGTWEQICRDLGICQRTADRYIDFSRIIRAYPRLLICGISFESIVCLYRKLQEHLLRDDTLSHRLQLPLKQTSIKSDIMLFSSPHHQLEVENPPVKLLTENADWQSGWQLADEIVEIRENEESSEESWHDAESDTTPDQPW